MIYLGYLPPEHRHAHTHKHTHNTSFFPPSLLFIRRRWRRDTPRGRREKSGRAASHCVALSHIIWQMQRFTNASFIPLFRLSFEFDSYPFVFRHNGKYDRGHAKNSRFPDLSFSSDVCSIIRWNIRRYTLTTRDVRTEPAAHRTTGSGQDIRITGVVVTYKPLAIILD